MGCESSKEDEFQPHNEAASKSTTASTPLPLPADATSGAAASTASFAEKQKAIALQSMQQRQGGSGMRGVKGPGGGMGGGGMCGCGAQMKTGMGDPRSGLLSAHPTPKLTDAEVFATLSRPKAPKQRRPRSATLKPTTGSGRQDPESQ
jgi:hypothetical protein|eukprot:jgi/Chrpa1/7869/Chrysochromulina_OHIO_Genome00020509-RA